MTMENGDARGSVCVLLIEDNKGFAYFIRDVLTRQSRGRFVLKESATLEQALDILKHEDVDVILLDLGLPDSVGFSTFVRTRAGAPHVPVIVLTVMDDDALAIRAMRQGAQDYLVKEQIDRNLLVRSIRYAMERAHIDRAVRTLSARLLRLQDEERRRIALALHDSTAQSLAALSMNLSLLGAMKERLPEEARALAAECIEYCDACANELRTTSYLLHPPLLDELGLAGAVREYADGFAVRSGIRVDLEIQRDLARLPEAIETALFRVIQEGLTNIHRHSGSRTASIRLGLADRQVVAEIRDTGCGIPLERMPESHGYSGVGVGIAGMTERMRQLEGRLEIETSESGTRVTATLPLPESVP
jgi:signal transduction histidine kinase